MDSLSTGNKILLAVIGALALVAVLWYMGYIGSTNKYTFTRGKGLDNGVCPGGAGDICIPDNCDNGNPQFGSCASNRNLKCSFVQHKQCPQNSNYFCPIGTDANNNKIGYCGIEGSIPSACLTAPCG